MLGINGGLPFQQIRRANIASIRGTISFNLSLAPTAKLGSSLMRTVTAVVQTVEELSSWSESKRLAMRGCDARMGAAAEGKVAWEVYKLSNVRS